MEKVKIVKVTRHERVSKSGKPYTSVGIQTLQYGEQWLNGFGNAENAAWKMGDEVTIEVEKRGEYLNFKMPQKMNETRIGDKIKEIELRLELLEKVILPKDL